jgi:hypothetical protein
MTRKVYRTAQGRTVDLGALQLQNENVRAVGNMGVNARGDLLDSANRPIATRNQQVGKQYNRQTSNVTNNSVASSVKSAQQVKADIPLPPEDFDDNFDKEEIAPAPGVASPRVPEGGLAAAIARAREVTQEPIKPLNNNKGITRV